jgi:hypothetical protein
MPKQTKSTRTLDARFDRNENGRAHGTPASRSSVGPGTALPVGRERGKATSRRPPDRDARAASGRLTARGQTPESRGSTNRRERGSTTHDTLSYACLYCKRVVNPTARHVVATVEHPYAHKPARTLRRRCHLSCLERFRKGCAEPPDPTVHRFRCRLVAAEVVAPTNDRVRPIAYALRSPMDHNPSWGCIACRRLINPKGCHVVAVIDHLYPNGTTLSSRRRFHPACFRLFRFLGDSSWDPTDLRVQYRLVTCTLVIPTHDAPAPDGALAEAR